jgi:hypothetical protein
MNVPPLVRLIVLLTYLLGKEFLLDLRHNGSAERRAEAVGLLLSQPQQPCRRSQVRSCRWAGHAE